MTVSQYWNKVKKLEDFYNGCNDLVLKQIYHIKLLKLMLKLEEVEKR